MSRVRNSALITHCALDLQHQRRKMVKSPALLPKNEPGVVNFSEKVQHPEGPLPSALRATHARILPWQRGTLRCFFGRTFTHESAASPISSFIIIFASDGPSARLVVSDRSLPVAPGRSAPRLRSLRAQPNFPARRIVQEAPGALLKDRTTLFEASLVHRWRWTSHILQNPVI